MPVADLPGIAIYYETYGEGREKAVVLINGLGSDHREWLYQVPAFRHDFRVVLFDNRGTGISDAPPGPYTTDLMAGDAARLLDYLGIERASVVGVSMGGMIAQKFAVLYPERVEKLVLACTSVGGERSVTPTKEAMEAFSSYDRGDPEGSLKRMVPYLYTEEFVREHRIEMERFFRYALNRNQSEEGYGAQISAIATHSSSGDLGGIGAATLVITGDADRLVLPENSEILARGIPGAKLETIRGAPHRFFAERWEEFNGKVLEFLLD